eukprot:TRINITY_DN53_c0_g1_i2.p2 TRINITY_DN53_c0_g1~~TRINITY_DN53_c0_g1_i2.p2  ORF type:complete len:1067 (-),score=116.09 TRINITY_DN53_c0_g1_i2:2428-5628(-)
MTGAGKTHTMLGDVYKTTTGEPGICTLSIDSLFHKITEDDTRQYRMKVSYLEIYNEQVKDLLTENLPRTPALGLMLVEDPVKGVVVPELTEYVVHNSKELLQLVLKGNEKRTMAATSVNQFSSRSHAILQIMLESSDSKSITTVTTAKLSLVDLAGSERAATTENRGLRMREGGKINRSLLALGNCINILSDKTRASASFVPYRDSKLTRLLKDSLGGNTKTVMIACVSPAGACYEETVNTLKYAERAKKIQKKVYRNVREIDFDVAKYKEIIESLKSEISTLKEQLQNQQGKEEVCPFDALQSKGSLVRYGSKHGTINLPGEKASTVLIGSESLVVNFPKDGSTKGLNEKIKEEASAKEIELLNEEIQKARQMKEKYQEELVKDSEDVRQSLQFSQSSVIDDDSYLNKLSQELLTKYEEHYEMKESVQELIELKGKNEALMDEYKSELETLIKIKKEADILGETTQIYETKISKKLEDIEDLKRANESNEEIRRELERALDENNKIQQKYLGLVIKLQSHRKKDVLELQISVRTLRLEKMDLMMQNLEMKKMARVAEIEKETREKELAQMRSELEDMKEQLKQKEMQLQTSKSQVVKQSQELQQLKKYKELYTELLQKATPQKVSENSYQPDSSKNSSPNLIKVTLRKSSEKKPLTTMKLVVTPRETLGEPANLIKESKPISRNATPKKTEDGKAFVPHQRQTCDIPKGSNSSRPNVRYNSKNIPTNFEEREHSFVSISSVSVNYNEMSGSDIEVMDNCVHALNRHKRSTSPGKKSPPVHKVELLSTGYAKYTAFNTARPKKSNRAPPRKEKREKIVIKSANTKNCQLPTRKSTAFMAQRRYTQIHTLRQRSSSAKPKLTYEEFKPKPRQSQKATLDFGRGFFSSVNENYSRTLNQLNPNRSARGPPVVPVHTNAHRRNSQRFPAEIPRSNSVKGPEMLNKPHFNVEEVKVIRESPEKVEKIQHLIRSHAEKTTGTLTCEIEELIRRQKESLKMDFEKAKEQNEVAKISQKKCASLAEAPISARGDSDEVVDDCGDSQKCIGLHIIVPVYLSFRCFIRISPHVFR